MPEIEAAYVSSSAYQKSISRTAIWQDMEKAISLLSGSVLVHAVWVGGSFVTDKLSPRDIDVTFVVSEEDRAKRSVADRQVVESFVNRVLDPVTGKKRPAHGLLVDSYVVNWAPYNLLPNGKMSAGHQGYATYRGYWDDWWGRHRVTPKTKPPTRQDALPLRGYLEVIVNAYA